MLELGCLAASATKQIVVTSIESITVLYGRKLICIVAKDCLLSGKEVIGGRVNGRVLNIRLCCIQSNVSEFSEMEVQLKRTQCVQLTSRVEVLEGRESVRHGEDDLGEES